MRKYQKANLDGENISKIRYQNNDDEFTGYAYKVNYLLVNMVNIGKHGYL